MGAGAHIARMRMSRPACARERDRKTCGRRRDELTALKQQQLATEAAGQAELAAGAPLIGARCSTRRRRRDASLGVRPEAWKPIKFMNNAHYDTLIES